MAEVDFGDSELFEQLEEDNKPVHIRFEDPGESGDEAQELRARLEECEATISCLRAENLELKRKLNLLTQPSGISMNDSKLDGPLFQILFMNNTISKQYHPEIEEFISSLVHKYEEQQKTDPEKTTFNVKPQPSSVVLEEDHKATSSKTIKKIKEAFSVVGSVLYFTSFCLDKLGQPLLSENPQLTDGWEIPTYQQVFSQILSLDGQELQVKAKRAKPSCFNCESAEHQLKDCPKPRDLARISEKRKEFREMCGESNNQNSQQRYHVEERFGKFKPGVISEELQDALGVTEKNLPPFIYRMRQLGYPPGWLKEVELENSGLALYDGKGSLDGELEDAEFRFQTSRVTYDVAKLVDYPGFNSYVPEGVSDEWQSYGSIPMNPSQQKEVFATYLTSNFPVASSKLNKRVLDSESNPYQSKKQKPLREEAQMSAVDMDVDSGSDTSYKEYSEFCFQPPLPPGSPITTTPPPLPRGTPPSTPPNFTPPPPLTPTPPPLPKETPPPTPSAGSPVVIDEVMVEDTLTLEELEEQQRMIWAALEQADSTNSDSEVPADTPLTGSSLASSPVRNELDDCRGEPSSFKIADAVKNGAVHPCMEELKGDQACSAEKAEAEAAENSPCLHSDVSNGQKELLLDNSCSAESSEENSEVVPDRSKFAAGITPFEYTNVAESTGVYLKLRNLLKNSPRNQMKNKK
ncbi:zinc finger CCHC domain-containing protein 8 [Latimeria chalumnae]|uniref:Zinc finger CCHC-type containing 8 n=1 Tax=Latimeria chalumnae TaxID=7897 RepID=H3BFA8_LATCH|nr:PREDICTED: zinc finger CCHC domain-containing protein 8 [Latimeria chalumnae]|eukprot:XP_005989029.1 PREDICTED: zinc finger CCHC domain-containing protein 8 [Latimeria chalumnae]